MRASRIVALSAFVLASLSAVAFAEEKKPIEVKILITGRRPPHTTVDIARVVQKAPLPDLRRPLIDPTGAALDRDPF